VILNISYNSTVTLWKNFICTLSIARIRCVSHVVTSKICVGPHFTSRENSVHVNVILDPHIRMPFQRLVRSPSIFMKKKRVTNLQLKKLTLTCYQHNHYHNSREIRIILTTISITAQHCRVTTYGTRAELLTTAANGTGRRSNTSTESTAEVCKLIVTTAVDEINKIIFTYDTTTSNLQIIRNTVFIK